LFPNQALPRNAKLLVGNSTVLATLGGAIVDVDVEASGVDGARWITPRELLTPGATYILAEPDGNEEADAGVSLNQRLQRFTVSDVIDQTALTVRGAGVEGSIGSGSCSLAVGAVLHTQSIVDTDNPGGPVYAQIDVTIGTHSERVILPLRAWTQPQSEEFGRADPKNPGDCLLSRTIASAEPDTKAMAAITFFDLAGNATHADPVSFEFLAVTLGGCPGPINATPGDTTAGTPMHEEPRPITTQDAGAAKIESALVSAPDTAPPVMNVEHRTDSGCAVQGSGSACSFEVALALSVLGLGARRRRRDHQAAQVR